jgi:denticleless
MISDFPGPLPFWPSGHVTQMGANLSRTDRVLFKLLQQFFLTTMSLTTSLTSRPVLVNRINVYTNSIPSPWSALQQAGTKRPASGPQCGGLKKRVKVNNSKEQKQQENIIEDDDSDCESDSDVEMADVVDVKPGSKRSTTFRMMAAAAMRVPISRQGIRTCFRCFVVFCILIYWIVSTRPILQTFVSSHKADVFRCYSIKADTYLTPPYACAYSNSMFIFI